MRGGHRYRCFFFIQASKFITAYNEGLPDVYPTNEEIEAGLHYLSEDFPVTATLFRISREMSIAPEVFMNDWSAREYYHLVNFLSWESKYQRDYQDIISRKNK